MHQPTHQPMHPQTPEPISTRPASARAEAATAPTGEGSAAAGSDGLPPEAATALDRVAAWSLPALALLLALQWPLRDLVQAGSRLANDIGQVLFALAMAAALPRATRARAHLAAHALWPRWRARHLGRLRQALMLLAVLPWSVYMVITALPLVWRSVRALEAFPDSFNPGYFLIKLALLMLCLGVARQALRDARRARPRDESRP
jgi:TRAP-type C4-dicarboxylate transport system permease small subunit